MPLFGSKHKHDNTNAVEETTGGGRHHRTDDHGLNNYPGEATTGGMGSSVPQQHQGGFGGPGQQGLNSDQAMAATNLSRGGGGAYGQGMTGQNQNFPHNDPYTTSGGGMGTGTGAHTGGGRAAASGPGAGGIPPTGAVHHDGTSGGTGQRLTGKVESALGSMVGSNALKAKGLQKEQEANSVKLQGRELAEAERLEREALMRRERAVGHGAHPANSQLGAGHIGTGPGAGGPGGQYN